MQEGTWSRRSDCRPERDRHRRVRNPDRSPVPTVFEGTWRVDGPEGEGQAILTFETENGVELDRRDTITLAFNDDGNLSATSYNLDIYGREGLEFTRIE